MPIRRNIEGITKGNLAIASVSYDDDMPIKPELIRKNAFRFAANRSQASLDMYGITRSDFMQIFIEQSGRCKMASCHWLFWEGSGVYPEVDHEHVEGFEVMPPEERRRYVRGLLCSVCNQMLARCNESPMLVANAMRDYLTAERPFEES